jgi:hypothetical protein
MDKSYYHASVANFVAASELSILGELTKAHGFALEHQQRQAWLGQIALLKLAVAPLADGQIFFEFAVPRLGKRVDAVILLPQLVLVLEFKVGATTYNGPDIAQAYDYALDLKNFHGGSHALRIVPALCATRATSTGPTTPIWREDLVAEPMLVNGFGLPALITHLAALDVGGAIDADAWLEAGYKPTPTIIEAAQALFQQHGVEEITRSDAGALNLTATTQALEQVIEVAKTRKHKAICFVTGVPGAGKTLVGLNIATTRAQHHSDEHAVFLSGNGPLVDVLREALARDEAARKDIAKTEAKRRVSSFVQNIHHFRDEALRDKKAPIERVVVFDEAQRAWTRDQASKFMKEKRGQADFNLSEPEFLIGVMDRHADWCVVICLIGGGQEINTGEAGLLEWLEALHRSYRGWQVYLSDRLNDEDYLRGEAHAAIKGLKVTVRSDLHLAVSMRSFRAEALSDFVDHVVAGRQAAARNAYTSIADRYPIFLARDLAAARAWLRAKARGSERFGLLASSGALRLRPEGIHIKAKVDPAAWFLNASSDVRSSYYCEEVASEFDVQGLELDWAGVCWDADFRHDGKRWQSFNFRGSKWVNVNSETDQLFLKNAYRVILTRARQGLVIFVPLGDPADATRPPSFYEGIADFMKSCGLIELQSQTAE